MNNPIVNWYYTSFFIQYLRGRRTFNKCCKDLIWKEKWEHCIDKNNKKERANSRKDIARVIVQLRQQRSSLSNSRLG